MDPPRDPGPRAVACLPIVAGGDLPRDTARRRGGCAYPWVDSALGDPRRREPGPVECGPLGMVPTMTTNWPACSYEGWRATCDTLHAHTQVLGKLAVRLAPPEPQLQHAALRLTARGWETSPLPAPNRSGSLVVVLDLRAHEAVVEHSGGRTARVPLTPNRPVGAVTRDVLAAARDLGGGPVEIDPAP